VDFSLSDFSLKATIVFIVFFMQFKMKQKVINSFLESNHSFFLCECTNEALLCSRFQGKDENEIFMSIFTCGQFHSKPNLIQRLKYCWYHLKTGKKYEDQIVLSFNEAQKLSVWLAQNAYSIVE
jgi:hypothetical protein